METKVNRICSMYLPSLLCNTKHIPTIIFHLDLAPNVHNHTSHHISMELKGLTCPTFPSVTNQARSIYFNFTWLHNLKFPKRSSWHRAVSPEGPTRYWPSRMLVAPKRPRISYANPLAMNPKMLAQTMSSYPPRLC